MPQKSTLNSKLGKVTNIAFCNVQAGESAGGNSILSRINGLSNTRLWFTKTNTGNSDGATMHVGFKQPTNPKDPYQIQYRWHARWTPAQAKKKGAAWTDYGENGGWKNFVAATGLAKDATTHPDTWLKPNMGVNKSSSFVICGTLSVKFTAANNMANYDAVSYQFRVRTYNQKTKKHGEWVYSEYMHVYKAPRVADVKVYSDEQGGLILKCNMRHGERKGTFSFTDIRVAFNSGGTGAVSNAVISYRNILKAKTTVSMVWDTSRTANSQPPKRDGFVPASCRIPLSKLKRGISPGENLYFGPTNAFVGNDNSGTASIIQNVAETLGDIGVGGLAYRKIQVSSKDITINPLKLVLKKATNKPYVQAWLYKTDANDTLESAAATLYYTYEGKTYSVKPAYTKLTLNVNSTRQAVAYWIFTSVPLGTKLAVSAKAANSYGSSQAVKNAIRLPSEFWYIQKEGDLSILAVLQWNVKVRSRSNPSYTLELPYGRGKPFVAYGEGLSRTYDISGEVPTQTQDPLFNKDYATKAAWTKVQSNPGIYVVRGPYAVVYRLAVTEVSLEQDDKTEILKVSFTGTEIE